MHGAYSITPWEDSVYPPMCFPWQEEGIRRSLDGRRGRARKAKGVEGVRREGNEVFLVAGLGCETTKIRGSQQY